MATTYPQMERHAFREAKPTDRFIYVATANGFAATDAESAVSLSLPSIGGDLSEGDIAVNVSLGGGLSVEIESVSGSVSGAEDGDSYLTTATTTLRGVNIGGVISADCIVGIVTSAYPRERAQSRRATPEHPSVFTFSGSRFENLRIHGRAAVPDEDPQLGAASGFRVLETDVATKSLFSLNGLRGIEVSGVGKIFFGQVDIFLGKVTLTMVQIEAPGSRIDADTDAGTSTGGLVLSFSTQSGNGHDGTH